LVADSLLEGNGFEPVWGFSRQVVVFGLLAVFVRSGKAVLRSLIAPQVSRRLFDLTVAASRPAAATLVRVRDCISICTEVTTGRSIRPYCVISCQCHRHTMASEDLPI